MKNEGVPLTSWRAPLRKSSRMRAACAPASTSRMIRSASKPRAEAYPARSSSSKAFWFSYRRSCIFQKRLCAQLAPVHLGPQHEHGVFLIEAFPELVVEGRLSQ